MSSPWCCPCTRIQSISLTGSIKIYNTADFDQSLAAFFSRFLPRILILLSWLETLALYGVPCVRTSGTLIPPHQQDEEEESQKKSDRAGKEGKRKKRPAKANIIVLIVIRKLILMYICTFFLPRRTRIRASALFWVSICVQPLPRNRLQRWILFFRLLSPSDGEFSVSSHLRDPCRCWAAEKGLRRCRGGHDDQGCRSKMLRSSSEPFVWMGVHGFLSPQLHALQTLRLPESVNGIPPICLSRYTSNTLETTLFLVWTDL